ncbi:MFS transporter [Streptomyces sp. NPDC006259]|uniref:MFS transporter n=1 Tax=Streptomyces sp. NPDC006259 TaxID=3364740 RepID=UPI00368B96D7
MRKNSDPKSHVTGSRRLAAFTFLFFSGMWLSKTVQPLYFERNGHLMAFGLSYTAMAVAGTASVFIGRLADRWGSRPVFLSGAFLYSAGMALRVVHAVPVVAILSGFIAGIGASGVFIAIRTWIVHHTEEDQRTGIVARREFMNHAGMALGTGAAGGLAALAGGGNRGYVFVLLLAAGCVLTAALVVPPDRTATERQSAFDGKSPADGGGTPGLVQTLRSHRALALGVVGLGLLMGFYASLLTPYLPLLLKERGVPLEFVGVVLAAAGLSRLTAAAMAGPVLRRRPPLRVFMLSESACAVATLILALSVSPWIAAAVLILRGVFLLGATVSQELLQLGAFPSAVAGAFFGLVQSAFLAGDALGGAVGGWLYQSLGSDRTVMVATVLTAANAIFVPLFYGRLRARMSDTSKEPAHVPG